MDRASRWTKTLLCFFFMLSTVYPRAVPAQNKVVVVPLGTTSGPSAPVAKSGQTSSFYINDDGALEKGVVAPSPRFIDNNNGTVSDRLTGLVWLKNGACAMFFPFDPNMGNVARTWTAAMTACNNLTNGYCGLSDNSQPGDWRLPNVRELQSLVDYGQWNPALSVDSPLRASTQLNLDYWTSTSYASENATRWTVNFWTGGVVNRVESTTYYIRAVRDRL